MIRNLNNEFETKKREEMSAEDTDMLIEVFKDGKITKEWTFQEIQERVNEFL